jgi:hypothetical protein
MNKDSGINQMKDFYVPDRDQSNFLNPERINVDIPSTKNIS